MPRSELARSPSVGECYEQGVGGGVSVLGDSRRREAYRHEIRTAGHNSFASDTFWTHQNEKRCPDEALTVYCCAARRMPFAGISSD